MINTMTNQTELEFPDCPLCDSKRRETSYAQFGEHKIMRCQDCSVYYLYPRLTESAMRSFYTNDSYFEGGDSGYSDTSYGDQERALSATFKRLMRNLHKRGLTGGSLLEVGCGYGYLLEEAVEYFSSRVGTEFSAQGVKLSATKADKVYEGGIEQIPADDQFDFVIATHVIEHIYQPQEFVKQLISHVKPNGTVVLAAPDMGGMLRKVMGHRWASFKIPEHVIYFDADTLSTLMKQTGLTDIQRLPYPHAFPLALIASKFGLPMPSALGKANIWVPATTIALSGKVSYE